MEDRGPTVVLVEDAVDDWVAAAGDEDEQLGGGVDVDEGGPVGAARAPAVRRRRVSFVRHQRHEFDDVVRQLADDEHRHHHDHLQSQHRPLSVSNVVSLANIVSGKGQTFE